MPILAGLVCDPEPNRLAGLVGGRSVFDGLAPLELL